MSKGGFQTFLFTEQSQKETFKRIRNFLAGRFVGATRDRTLLEEVIKCYFSGYYIASQKIELLSRPDGIVLSKKYKEVFQELKRKLPFVFNAAEEIQLDPVSIAFVHSELTQIDFSSPERDPLGDLYEVFIGTGIREEEGQFFTPGNGVDFLVRLTKPLPGERIIDPAAGAGGFLSAAVQHLIRQKVSLREAVAQVFGIEKDAYLAKLSATRLAMLSMGESNVFCGDSLAWLDTKEQRLPIEQDGAFDVVLTNPPFGKNIVAATKAEQGKFELGHDWKWNAAKETYERNGKLQPNVPPQVLFVERCLNLLKPNGRLGMVVPESLITSKSYAYVVEFMRRHGEFEVVAGMPEDFFKTSGKGGTHTKACLILFNKGVLKPDHKIFLAEARWCGHDSRGRTIEHDDLPDILENYDRHKSGAWFEPSKLGYVIAPYEVENQVLSPRFYNPDIKNSLDAVLDTHYMVRLGDLVKQGVLEIKTGNEVGKLSYGSGEIPFVRTSDISNWEIKIDTKHGVSEEVYQSVAAKQDVREGDILMVKDGTYLIGTCAFVSKYDTKIVYQSHLYKIRVIKPAKITPYLLLAILTSEPVQNQIKSKRVTQDIIDSLGSRIYELVLPVPKDKTLCRDIENKVKKAIEDRMEARELAKQACLEVAGALEAVMV